jgi:hypothetical protein
MKDPNALQLSEQEDAVVEAIEKHIAASVWAAFVPIPKVFAENKASREEFRNMLVERLAMRVNLRLLCDPDVDAWYAVCHPLSG